MDYDKTKKFLRFEALKSFSFVDGT